MGYTWLGLLFVPSIGPSFLASSIQHLAISCGRVVLSLSDAPSFNLLLYVLGNNEVKVVVEIWSEHTRGGSMMIPPLAFLVSFSSNYPCVSPTIYLVANYCAIRPLTWSRPNIQSALLATRVERHTNQ